MSRKHKQGNDNLNPPVHPAEEFLKKYLNSLHHERSKSPPSLFEIEGDIASCEEACERIKTEIKRREKLISRWKQEIKEWKSWYNGSPKIDKSEEWAKMDAEVQWRSIEIQSSQVVINGLYESLYPAKTELEVARHRLIAHTQGCLERPLREDPRYLGILQALESDNQPHPSKKDS